MTQEFLILFSTQFIIHAHLEEVVWDITKVEFVVFWILVYLLQGLLKEIKLSDLSLTENSEGSYALISCHCAEVLSYMFIIVPFPRHSKSYWIMEYFLPTDSRMFPWPTINLQNSHVWMINKYYLLGMNSILFYQFFEDGENDLSLLKLLHPLSGNSLKDLYVKFVVDLSGVVSDEFENLVCMRSIGFWVKAYQSWNSEQLGGQFFYWIWYKNYLHESSLSDNSLAMSWILSFNFSPPSAC